MAAKKKEKKLPEFKTMNAMLSAYTKGKLPGLRLFIDWMSPGDLMFELPVKGHPFNAHCVLEVRGDTFAKHMLKRLGLPIRVVSE